MVKETELRAKVEMPMREKLEAIARARGEKLAVIVRMAIFDFIQEHESEAGQNLPPTIAASAPPPNTH